MLPEQRKREIFSLIKRRGAISVSELSDIFSITATTIRKDLDALEEQGLIERTHGGALLPSYGRGRDVPINQRQTMQALEKERIAHSALRFVEPGDTIVLDDSSTVLCLARLLLEIKELTVVTNSLNVMDVLAKADGLCLYGLGGELNRDSRSFVGGETEDALARLHVDKCFVSTKGISVDTGLTDVHFHAARLHRKMLKASKKRILLMDNSKFDVVCFADVAPLESVHYVLTDAEPPESYYQELGDLGVELIVTRG